MNSEMCVHCPSIVVVRSVHRVRILRLHCVNRDMHMQCNCRHGSAMQCHQSPFNCEWIAVGIFRPHAIITSNPSPPHHPLLLAGIARCPPVFVVVGWLVGWLSSQCAFWASRTGQDRLLPPTTTAVIACFMCRPVSPIASSWQLGTAFFVTFLPFPFGAASLLACLLLRIPHFCTHTQRIHSIPKPTLPMAGHIHSFIRSEILLVNQAIPKNIVKIFFLYTIQLTFSTSNFFAITHTKSQLGLTV